MTTVPLHKRLEPHPLQSDWDEGFASPIQDPLWFLGRQWQMGEHQGENASSPVWVQYDLKSIPIRFTNPVFDPQIIPGEVLVEYEASDWWTMGRRIRIGKKLLDNLNLNEKEKKLYCFDNPPPPYEFFEGYLDGLAIWKNREKLGLINDPIWSEIPQHVISCWSNTELIYQQSEKNSFLADNKRLQVNRHRGGRLDWHSIEAFPNLNNKNSAIIEKDRNVIPTALNYPGAPTSRWWEIEHSDVDAGGYAPDSAHSATAIITDLIYSHSDDWFIFPVQAEAGNVVSIENIIITDTFGRKYGSKNNHDFAVSDYIGLQPPSNWEIFRVNSLENNELILWHVAELPLESNVIERVQFGIDEESNLLWAVERIIDSRDTDMKKQNGEDGITKIFNPGDPSGENQEGVEKEYAYIPARGITQFWHPYELTDENGERMLIQRKLPDFSKQPAVAMPSPKAEILQPENNGGIHQIRPLAIPGNGIAIERRWMLARDMNGNPVLWIQRQRKPLLAPPARRLRFEVLEKANKDNSINP